MRSILFLGPEIVRTWRGETRLTIRRPWLVAFAFGLLHGLGVAIGQLVFVFLVLAMAWSYRQLEIVWPRWALALPGYMVGSLGAFWTIQRTAILLGFVR